MLGFKEHYEGWWRYNNDASLVERHTKWQEIHTDADGNRCIEFDENVFRRIDDCIISIEEGRLHLCISAQVTVVLPDGIRSLAICSMDSRWCTGLKHLIIPSSVQSISQHAFLSDTLQTITILNPDIAIHDCALDGCPCLETVKCPPLGKVFPLKVKSMYIFEKSSEGSRTRSIQDMAEDDLPF